VPVGVVDKPFEQRRDLLWADLSGAAGHVVVVGPSGSGKSTLLRTLVVSLALTHTPAEVQFLCVDLGGGMGNELVSAGLDDVFVAKYDSAGNWIWSVGVGDSDNQGALAVAIDSDDNIWVAGTVKGTFNFLGGDPITNGGAQFPDAWFAKLNVNGGAAGFEGSYGQNTLYSEFGRALGAGPAGTIAFVGTFQDNLVLGGGLTAAGRAD